MTGNRWRGKIKQLRDPKNNTGTTGIASKVGIPLTRKPLILRNGYQDGNFFEGEKVGRKGDYPGLEEAIRSRL